MNCVKKKLLIRPLFIVFRIILLYIFSSLNSEASFKIFPDETRSNSLITGTYKSCYDFVNQTIQHLVTSEALEDLYILQEGALLNKPDFYRDSEKQMIPYHYYLIAAALKTDNAHSDYWGVRDLDKIQQNDILIYVDKNYNPDLKARKPNQSPGTHLAFVHSMVEETEHFIILKLLDVSKRRKGRSPLHPDSKNPPHTLGLAYSYLIVYKAPHKSGPPPLYICRFKGQASIKEYYIQILYNKK